MVAGPIDVALAVALVISADDVVLHAALLLADQQGLIAVRALMLLEHLLYFTGR